MRQLVTPFSSSAHPLNDKNGGVVSLLQGQNG